MVGFNSDIDCRYVGPIENLDTLAETFLPIITGPFPELAGSSGRGLMSYLRQNPCYGLNELTFLHGVKTYVQSSKISNKIEILASVEFLEDGVKANMETYGTNKNDTSHVQRVFERKIISGAMIDPEIVQGSGIRRNKMTYNWGEKYA